MPIGSNYQRPARWRPRRAAVVGAESALTLRAGVDGTVARGEAAYVSLEHELGSVVRDPCDSSACRPDQHPDMVTRMATAAKSERLFLDTESADRTP